MTVAELIEKLRLCDQDKSVVILVNKFQDYLYPSAKANGLVEGSDYVWLSGDWGNIDEDSPCE